MKKAPFYLRAAKYSVQMLALLVVLVFGACTRNTDSASGNQPIAPGGAVLEEQAGGCGSFDPNHSVLPFIFLLSGRNGNNTLDPLCEFHPVIRNSSNQGIQGVTVTLTWSDAKFPNRRYCLDPAFPNMTYSYDPSTGVHTLTAVTDYYGNARFRLMGAYTAHIECGFNNTTDSFTGQTGLMKFTFPGESSPCPLQFGFKVATPDLNGFNGVDSADYSLFLNDKFCGTYVDDCDKGNHYAARSDFNGDGKIDCNDETIFNAIRFGAGSLFSTCNLME